MKLFILISSIIAFYFVFPISCFLPWKSLLNFIGFFVLNEVRLNNDQNFKNDCFINKHKLNANKSYFNGGKRQSVNTLFCSTQNKTKQKLQISMKMSHNLPPLTISKIFNRHCRSNVWCGSLIVYVRVWYVYTL